MVPIDPVVAQFATRMTARVSAVIFALGLFLAARRLGAPSGDPNVERARRTMDVAAFVAFLIAHTIHFICVLLLARATDGESIRQAGGWTAALMVGGLFYWGWWSVFHLKRRPERAWATAHLRRKELLVLAAIWLIFVSNYAGRALESPLWVILALTLVVAFLRFLVEALKTSRRRPDPSVPQSV